MAAKPTETRERGVMVIEVHRQAFRVPSTSRSDRARRRDTVPLLGLVGVGIALAGALALSRAPLRLPAAPPSRMDVAPVRPRARNTAAIARRAYRHFAASRVLINACSCTELHPRSPRAPVDSRRCNIRGIP